MPRQAAESAGKNQEVPDYPCYQQMTFLSPINRKTSQFSFAKKLRPAYDIFCIFL